VNHSMTSILIQLLKRLASAAPGEPVDQDALVEELMDQGHTPEEIRRAMMLINDRFAEPGNVYEDNSQHPHSSRVLMNEERVALTKEAQLLLIEMQTHGQMGPADTEAFIEKALWARETKRDSDELGVHMRRQILFKNLHPSDRHRVVLPKKSSNN
jgi:uncharacterized protein Smg (DUF494 family)